MIRGFLALLAAVLIFSGCSTLENMGQKHKVKALVEDAVVVVEREGASALPRLREAPWRDGELYLFVNALDGIQLFHAITPENEGKSRLGITDVNGVLVIEDMIAIAKTRGSGWTEYHWQNPVSGNVEAKRSYVKAAVMDGREVFVGAGYYHK